jgi:hypothetical protein
MTAKTQSLSIKAIRASSDRASLEKKFEKYRISSKKRRIDLMLEAMGDPVVSYSSGYPNINERYEIIIGSLLSGIWRRDFFSYKAGGN